LVLNVMISETNQSAIIHRVCAGHQKIWRKKSR
jgi:hypothetical protein